MPLVFLTKAEKVKSRLASYVYGELHTRKISQSELATAMNVSQQALSKKIQRKHFRFEDFVAIVDFFEPDEKELSRLLGRGE